MNIQFTKLIFIFLILTQTIYAEDTDTEKLCQDFMHIIVEEASIPLPHDSLCYSQYLDNIKGSLFAIRYLQHDFYQRGIRMSQKSSLDDIENLKQILKLCLNVRENEAKYPDYYQFVTAQTSQYNAYQVIAKELYQMNTKQMREDFEFLRYPSSSLISHFDEFFIKYPQLLANADNTIDGSNFLIDTDINPEIGSQLISANPSLETHSPYDSAMWIFMEGKGAMRAFPFFKAQIPPEKECFKSHLRQLFVAAGIFQEKIEPYLDLLVENAPQTPEGIISQIFIPKQRIREFAYVSLPCGFYDAKSSNEIDKTISDFQLDRMQETYSYENLQFRLLAGKLFDDEVRIFRYSLIPIEEQNAYRKLVLEVLKKIE